MHNMIPADWEKYHEHTTYWLILRAVKEFNISTSWTTPFKHTHPCPGTKNPGHQKSEDCIHSFIQPHTFMSSHMVQQQWRLWAWFKCSTDDHREQRPQLSWALTGGLNRETGRPGNKTLCNGGKLGIRVHLTCCQDPNCTATMTLFHHETSQCSTASESSYAHSPFSLSHSESCDMAA